MKITETAHEKLLELFGEPENAGKNLRLFSRGFGWGGPRLDLALDEQNKNDGLIDINGIKVVFETNLEMFTKSVKIDYLDDPVYGSGFQIGTDYGC